MRKALIILSCILAIYGVIGAQSGAITDCKRVTFCETSTESNGDCTVHWEYERCSGGFTGVFTPCDNSCEQDSCSCNCGTEPNSIYSVSYVDCQGVLKFESKSCNACETPTPTPTPTPIPTPTPCAELNQSCYYPYDCCGGTICGNLSYVCIMCEPNPQDQHRTCMSERCRDCYSNGGVFCTGEGDDCWTPIVVDVRGDGFDLTDANSGVNFSDGRGTVLRTAWTAANNDDAWLVLDRNGNGSIDDGTELFGNATPQPPTNGLYNGFRALNEYDKPSTGGNQDGYITKRDSVYSALRLWQDTNHDGISVPSELHTLAEFEVASIELEYKLFKYKDANGNTFKYRAKIRNAKGLQMGGWVYDVFLDARRAQ